MRERLAVREEREKGETGPLLPLCPPWTCSLLLLLLLLAAAADDEAAAELDRNGVGERPARLAHHDGQRYGGLRLRRGRGIGSRGRERRQ